VRLVLHTPCVSDTLLTFSFPFKIRRQVMKLKKIVLILCTLFAISAISVNARRGGGMRRGGMRGGIGRAAGPRRMGMRHGGWSGRRGGWGRRGWRHRGGRRYYGPNVWWGGPYYNNYPGYYCPVWHPDYPYCDYPGFGISVNI
jgi:hypothetical protein